MTSIDIKHERIRLAIVNMRLARVQLRKAGADKAADAVARALKSVEGAQRHALSMETRQAWKTRQALLVEDGTS